ncbi:M23 family metallopeptidase [Natrinema ejinorense]|uniref:Peptidase M23 n=1 Tax=Natrinema ejinorense TaxID=373386 RepID=A0A2A5QUC5_9EURY|nr:M23 family metallopeptidase [Natrinema ejinorense]PCR90451.1 peptidase M23 [Natrinema ejinorense]
MSDPNTHPNLPSVDRSNGLRSRLPSPTSLALLFFLGIPGSLIPSLKRLEWFYLFGLFTLWHMVTGIVPSPSDDAEATNWISMGTPSGLRPLVSMVSLQLNPLIQWQGVKQIAGHGLTFLRYRLRLPDLDRFDQQVDYRLPVEGEWTVVNGGPTRDTSHSWGILAQRYAYDLVVTDDDGRSYEGSGDRPAEYHCFGEPIVAPADGVVVAASDGHRDYHRAGGWLDPRQRDLRGNFLTIEHATGEYSVLAHLRNGSLEVSKGDRVERGERVARCGNSGNSSEPHLHFQLQDRPSFFRSMGLPIHFSNLRLREPDGEETVHERAYIAAGQRVASTE